MEYVEKYVTWFEEWELYVDYLSKLPAPLNNPIFLSILTVIAVITLASTIISRIQTMRFHRRIKQKTRELEEKKLENKLKEEEEVKRKDSDNEMMSNYLKFMMMAQVQGMTSLKGMTYEQFQQNMNQNPDIIDVVSNAPSEDELERKYWTDAVTGLFNRNAFEKKVNEIEITSLGLVSIDANDLKKTNDTQGHEAGDHLLCGIADAIKDVWGDEKGFRTGGDEFTVVLVNANRRVTENNIIAFKEILAENNLSAAAGYACASDVSGKPTIEKIIKQSDEAMYADKKAFKQARADAEEAARRAEEARLAEEQARIEEEQARIEEERLKAEQEAKELKEAEARRLAEEQAREEERRKQDALLNSITEANLQDTYLEEDVPGYTDFELPTAMEDTSEPEDEAEPEDVHSILDAAPTVEDASNDADSLTSEQQNDFAKLVAMMQAETTQKEQVSAYNKQKNEIAKKNADVLSKRLQSDMEGSGNRSSVRTNSAGDDIDSLHKAALAAMEAEAEKGKKRSLFGKKK